jgi:hypothetical protein
VENVQFVGGGGPDRVYLFDAATDDRLSIWPNRAELTGVGYSFAVEQVSRIFVHALQGGDDQAFVYDSSGNDTLSVRPQFTSMSGIGFFNYLSGFERVFAYANTGGVDRAQLYDSIGNDLFSTSGEVTSLVGPGFSTFARGFEHVEAFANAGGLDRALVYAPTGGRLNVGVDFVGMEGPNRSSIARGFERTETFANALTNNANSIRTGSLTFESEQRLIDDSTMIAQTMTLVLQTSASETEAQTEAHYGHRSESDDPQRQPNYEPEPDMYFPPSGQLAGVVEWSELWHRSDAMEEALDALIGAETENDRDLLDEIFDRL